jgi:hypothetical protein
MLGAPSSRQSGTSRSSTASHCHGSADRIRALCDELTGLDSSTLPSGARRQLLRLLEVGRAVAAADVLECDGVGLAGLA